MTRTPHVREPDVRRTEASCSQEEIWALERAFPGSPAHVLHRAYRVTGELDVTALRAAWRAVVRRHEILRTTLVESDGRPLQEIAGEGHDGTWSAELGETPAAGPGRPPFSLSGGPLVHLAVARRGPAEHLVTLAAHRAVCDDRSMSLLVDELSAHYAAEAGGPPAPAEPAPRYSDYARWQRGRIATPAFRRLLDRRAATPPPPPPALPTDRARPPGRPVRSGVLRFDWGADFGRALARFAAAEHASAADVLLSGLVSLLYRYGDEERVPVSVATAAVAESRFEGLVGPLPGPPSLWADLSGAPSFRELLGRVSRLAREAAEHRDPPVDLLARAARPDRDPARDVVFEFAAGPEAVLGVPGAAVAPVRADHGSTAADLVLRVERAVPSTAGALEYRAALFDRESARYLLDRLRTLLAAAVDAPATPVAELPLERPDELRAAMRDADQIAAARPPARPVHELVHAWARRRPDAAAVSWDGGTVSYRELAERAAPVAAALRAAGEVAGSAVAVRMAAGPRQAAALLGVFDTGAHAVCLSTADSGERDRQVLADLRPECLVLDGERGEDALAEWYRSELNGRVVDVAALGPGGPPPVPGAPGGRAYVAYTSGSTGRPKGIAHTHATLAQFTTWLAAGFGVGPGSRVAQWAAPGYDASLCEVFAALVAGATLCPVPERIRVHPERLADWLDAERITLFQTVPSFAGELLRVIARRGPGGAPASLDHLLLAGEPLHGELADGLRAALPNVRLVNLYGPTESILATWHEITGPVHGTAPIGRPIPGRQVLVLDERDRPCPAGVTGEIVIRGPHVTPGYVGAAAEDRAPFRPPHGLREFGDADGPCYRTGDLARRRRDGVLEFRGRRDFQVKFYGTRVELTDIEAALAAHESVAECAVVAVTGQDGLVRRLVAYVVPRRTPAADPAGSPGVWRAHLHRRFGKAKLPVSFTTLERLPRNVGGKVDRRRLPVPEAIPQ